MADNPIPPEPALTAWRVVDAAVLAAKVAAAVAMAGVAMAADAEVVVVAEAATVAVVVADLSVAKTQPIQTPACQSLRNKVLKA